MKNIFLLAITFLTSTITFAQEEIIEIIEIAEVQEEAPFTIVEQMPDYVGGIEARDKFIQKNIVYPEAESKAKIKGTCFVTFVVEKDGSVTNVKILRGVAGGPGLDAESIRVVSMMPKWIPGKQNGNLVRVQYNLPIKFK